MDPCILHIFGGYNIFLPIREKLTLSHIKDIQHLPQVNFCKSPESVISITNSNKICTYFSSSFPESVISITNSNKICTYFSSSLYARCPVFSLILYIRGMMKVLPIGPQSGIFLTLDWSIEYLYKKDIRLDSELNRKLKQECVGNMGALDEWKKN